jgi:hypothetical protein
MKLAAVLFVAFACSGAFASEPGQPLDCSDWVFVAPGLSVLPWSLPIAEDKLQYALLNARAAFDSTGQALQIKHCNDSVLCGGACANGLALMSNNDGVEAVIACLPQRSGSVPGSYDRAIEDISPFVNNSYPGVCRVPIPDNTGGPFPTCMRFDPAKGRLYFSFVAEGPGYVGPEAYNPVVQRCVFEGFSTLNDVVQTFTPEPAALGFRIPYLPEGMAGVDHFDTYWGNLAHPIDFTQAHPLQCDYPASAPHVGDYLTVGDTVPSPAPGQGVYYITSATYQGATRYGRKTTAGHLSGRDPSLLPVCALP